MKIYTRTGDEGDTGLLGGIRVRKCDPRVAAFGTVDELNATLGLALALDRTAETLLDASRVEEIQADLFSIGAWLAAADPERAHRKGTIPTLPAERIAAFEAWIDELDEALDPLEAFVLPGGTVLASQLHVARTVCRRAEREIVEILDEIPAVGEVILPYLNRLSDLLFTLARHANRQAGPGDTTWLPQRAR